MEEVKFEGDIFHDKQKAIEWFESILWPNGPICPHCKNTERIYEIKGKGARPGLRSCSACRKQFTVTIETIFENSSVPLNKWLMAWVLFEDNFSTLKISRIINVTYKTAWYMILRIKHDMGLLKNNELFGWKVRIALYNLTSQGKIKKDGKYYYPIDF